MKKSKANEIAIDNDWQAENDANTLVHAAAIRADKERCAKAIKYAKSKVQQMKGVIMESLEEESEEDDD
jgi:hypothetical protein